MNANPNLITPDIIYIGQDDPTLELFESQYILPEGMCYNSYLIKDSKTAILDTSDSRTLDGWKSDLFRALGDSVPDFLIVHHLEPDHASGISEVLDLFPRLRLVCTERAAKMLPLYFERADLGERTLTVKEGDRLSLGRHELSFMMAPMVHWPEVMLTYDSTDKVLFSADAFGKFGVKDADPDDWACEARRYYFNICGKYGVPVSTLLDKVDSVEIDQVLPLHGPELRGERLAEALRLYGIWSAYGVETEGVFIAHASIHGNTAKAALMLAEILRSKGCPKVAISDLCRDDQAEALEDAFRYGTVVLAASSYDGGVFTPMHDFLHKLDSKLWQNRKVAIVENGSWAPSAARTMRGMLASMRNVELCGGTLTLRGPLKDSDIPALEALADAIL